VLDDDGTQTVYVYCNICILQDIYVDAVT